MTKKEGQTRSIELCVRVWKAGTTCPVDDMSNPPHRDTILECDCRIYFFFFQSSTPRSGIDQPSKALVFITLGASCRDFDIKLGRLDEPHVLQGPLLLSRRMDLRVNLLAQRTKVLKENEKLTSNLIRKLGTNLYISNKAIFRPIHALVPAPKCNNVALISLTLCFSFS